MEWNNLLCCFLGFVDCLFHVLSSDSQVYFFGGPRCHCLDLFVSLIYAPSSRTSTPFAGLRIAAGSFPCADRKQDSSVRSSST